MKISSYTTHNVRVLTNSRDRSMREREPAKNWTRFADCVMASTQGQKRTFYIEMHRELHSEFLSLTCKAQTPGHHRRASAEHSALIHWAEIIQRSPDQASLCSLEMMSCPCSSLAVAVNVAVMVCVAMLYRRRTGCSAEHWVEHRTNGSCHVHSVQAFFEYDLEAPDVPAAGLDCASSLNEGGDLRELIGELLQPRTATHELTLSKIEQSSWLTQRKEQTIFTMQNFE